jgi:hypothetical protein
VVCTHARPGAGRLEPLRFDVRRRVALRRATIDLTSKEVLDGSPAPSAACQDACPARDRDPQSKLLIMGIRDQVLARTTRRSWSRRAGDDLGLRDVRRVRRGVSVSIEHLTTSSTSAEAA